jgi:hypothetical protein
MLTHLPLRTEATAHVPPSPVVCTRKCAGVCVRMEEESGDKVGGEDRHTDVLKGEREKERERE